jgi:hypothetical protein
MCSIQLASSEGRINAPESGGVSVSASFAMTDLPRNRSESTSETTRPFFHTFCPFQIGDLDYALYSPQYHVTRVMELPACKDIGGEDLQGEGFCPTDFRGPTSTRSPKNLPRVRP